MTDVHRIRVFEYVPSPIVSCSLSDDTLLVGRESGYVEIWDVQNYAHCMCSFQATTPRDIRVVLWTEFKEQKAFAICLFSGEVVIYNYPSLQIVGQSPSFGGAIWGAATSSDKSLLAIACDDGVVRVFNTKDNLYLIQTSDALVSKCLSVCFSSDGSLYAGDSTGQIVQINLESRTFSHTLNVAARDTTSSEVSVWALCALPNGQIASGDSNGNVIIWNTMTDTVETRFASHQADVLTLASNGRFLYAAGIDPTVVTFEHDDGQWVQRNQQRFHTHDVTCIVANEKHVISAGMDACICSKDLIHPFQVPIPIAVATRGDDIIAVGGEGNRLSIWRLNGEEAFLEVRLQTSNPVDAVAISSDGKNVAYSSTNTRFLEYDGTNWTLNKEKKHPKASAIINRENEFIMATISGDILSSDGSFAHVDFPVFKLAVCEKYIVAGGLKRLVSFEKDLNGKSTELPYFGSPFSAIRFKPKTNLLFVSTSSTKIFSYDVSEEKLVASANINIGKFGEIVAPTSISFDPDDTNRVLVVSSQVTLVANSMKEKGKFRLPYEDFLFGDFVKGKKLVVYEKPWSFMMHSLPMPFRVKRFQGSEETKRPRY
ncbi:hypothetical protein TVAG_045690 [Trichomonas vaginalis G3]|uniref:Anaphase-promoting complex subunit 4 WD40 domain-containing protein n=1 Tax=Trichomonas vaginalis (strain ATCC PRA-98 / G3) TaxID=412133 RepID=A2DME0_TRIV3|nr:maturation of SSU-rRNA [Trichomonas vaginalis G3]EAY18367.1 hypothetical protein TVAG_045690 [Trichomonas vaginalis G3]KAI5524168.1 maturation of SSU-rRNA [Trichomonas vaginalis G3]|eukprot:XP_001579353.1 hypothetical protein [Trichomonas vaginalis G3]